MYKIEDIVNKVHCADCLEFMRGIPDGAVDLCLTDPPYGIVYNSNRYIHGNPHAKIVGDECLSFPLDELWRITKDDGAIFAFYSHKQPLQDARIKNIIVWVKNNWSAGDLEGDFGNQYEMIAFIPKPDFKLKGDKRYSNVWYCDREKPVLHPTQKPIGILYKAIKSASNAGDLILDPFLGSGTTCVAAKQLGRRFIGIEISPEYCRIANERLRQEYLI